MNDKTQKNIWRYIIIGVISLYVIVSFVIVYFISSAPTNYYNKEQEKQYQIIKAAIDTELRDETQDKMKQQEFFKDLYENNSIEFIVYSENSDEIVYKTIAIDPTNNTENILNKNSVFKEEIFEVQNGQEKYNVWLAQYFVSPQEIFDSIIFALIISVLGLLVVIFSAIVILFLWTINPLKRLRKSIAKVSSYQLEQLTNNDKITEYDALSHELFLFAQDLESKIVNYGENYTALEKALQLKNSSLEYQSKMVATMVHDLKIPLHIVRLNLENIRRKQKHSDEENEKLIHLDTKIDAIMEKLNDIVRVSKMTNIEALQQTETFDLIEVFFDVYDDFEEIFEEKQLISEVDGDEELSILGNKARVQQLIYNALSNIAQHAINGGEVRISCYQENDMVKLYFYNDAKELSENEIKNAFNLFYRVEKSETKKHGLGFGMYSIKDIVKELHGEVRFEKNYSGVELIISFPVEF